MFESYQIISSTDKILSRYSLSLSDHTYPINKPCTIQKGVSGYVITSENDRELRRMKFGLTPHWSKTPMDIINARAEGDKNQDNDPYYNGPNSIFLKPAFKKAIQQYRCLVIADSYIEIINNQTNLIAFPENHLPCVFAGIYDYWHDPLTKIQIPGFAIITIPADEALQSIGINRMPLLLSYFNCTNWVKPQKPMNYYLPLLNTVNNQPVSVITFDTNGNAIKTNQTKSIEETGINPLPKRYYSKKHNQSPFDNMTLAERIEREKAMKFNSKL